MSAGANGTERDRGEFPARVSTIDRHRFLSMWRRTVAQSDVFKPDPSVFVII